MTGVSSTTSGVMLQTISVDTKPTLATDCRDISQLVQNKSKMIRSVVAEPSVGSFHLPKVDPADSEGAGNWGTSWDMMTRKKVKFLTAGRTLLEGEPEVFGSDRAVFALRISMIANYCVVQLIGSLFAIVYFGRVVFARYELLAVITFSANVVVLVCLAHFANRFAWIPQRQVFSACTAGLMINNLVVPFLCQISKCNIGWHWSGALFIWMLGAPLGAVVLTDRPAVYGGMTTGVMILMMAGVMATFAHTSPALTWEGEDTLMRILLAILIPYWLMPACIATMFRWECREHRVRLLAQVEQHRALMEVRSTLQWLIFSIVPPSKARQLPAISPERWYTAAYDEYPDCTLLQMDVSGFTALSSKIGSDELVELIQSLFVSVDYAAECIQCIWKVELIGDCYKALIGGPQPCDDHAERGVALAYSIVDICKAMAKRLNVGLCVRVGVHTGSVKAAVVGVRMPRYLMFGPDSEVVNLLEVEADRDSVLLSESTAARVAHCWPHSEQRTLILPDGAQCLAYSSTEEEKEAVKEEGGGGGHAGMLKGRFPELAVFLREFGRSLDAPRRVSLCCTEGSGSASSLLPPVPLNTAGIIMARGSGADAPSLSPSSLSFSKRGFRNSIAADASHAPRPAQLSEGASDSFTRTEKEPSAPVLRARIRHIATAASRVRGDFQRARTCEGDVVLALDDVAMHVREARTASRGEAAAAAAEMHSAGAATVEAIPEGNAAEEMVKLLTDYEEAEGTASPATSISYQRGVARLLLLACALTCTLQLALLALFGAPSPPSLAQHACFLPALLLALLLLLAAALIALKLGGDWSSGWPQTLVSVLLFGAALALEGLGGGQKATHWPALLWAFLGVLLQCAATDLASRRWILWLLLYLGLCVGVIVWEWKHEAGIESVRDVPWWREVLMGWTFALTTTLCIVPLAFPAMAVVCMQKKARELLLNTQRLLDLEDTLVDALAPPALSRRFLRGDQLVVDGIAEGTAMFVYLFGYNEAIMCHGAPTTIAWVNAIYEVIDAEINLSSSVKVETFNNFVLVFSTEPSQHVRVCLSLAMSILKAVKHIPRPDGTPTELKIGVSSGSFTTGIIGLQSPRFSIFGDTVNTASRMASTSMPTTALNPFIQVSATAFALLGEDGLDEWMRGLGEGMSMSERSEKTEVKGKGLMQTFCLQRPDPAAQQMRS